LRAPLKNHFGSQATMCNSGGCQEKAALTTVNADFSMLPDNAGRLILAPERFMERLLPF
jgi:hypothetical protein